MRLLFVVDGRSPIALNWIAHFTRQGHEVYLASTYPAHPDLDLAGLYTIPVALSQAAGDTPAGTSGSKGGRGMRRFVPVGLRTRLRQWLGPATLSAAARSLQRILEQVQPDLVHAMRIPYEGMLAALANPGAPLLISVWGNDFTLHAPATLRMNSLTRQALARADALHADCRRDIRLANEWGFSQEKPFTVLPGGGGIQLDIFYPPPDDGARPPLAFNPRGMRAYLRNDVFFKAIPLVLKRHPDTRFACASMAGEAQAERWLQTLGVAANVTLLPPMPRLQMADWYRQAQVLVSPSIHDGTTNTVLEGMACGCFPVVGDIESLREWITPGVNGLLVDPADPQALADAILHALDQPGLRQSASVHNRQLVAARAEYGLVMQQAEQFYEHIVETLRR